MKALYSKYRDQGVEFIGVSSDASVEKGGLDLLKAFVKQNQIAWPQYHQGRVGEGSFTDDCGVNALPTVFVVDTEGKLASVDGRGRLDQLIPALLEATKQ